MLVGICEISFLQFSFWIRWPCFGRATLLKQVSVLVDETRRLPAPRFVKRVEKMCESALAARGAIARYRDFGSTVDRRAVGVFHQTTRSKGETDRAMLLD
jgi:hypothetical protein